jgi:pimeloyl-ACP methyl ester carboxylesterase
MTALPSVEAWQASGRYFDFKGHRVFLRVDGPEDAPPLLLIHGFPTASWDWCKLWPELARTHRLIAADMLGLGLSAKPRGHRYTVAEQADLFVAACAEAGVHEVAVLAHDLGDTVAQELIARQLDGRLPLHLRGVILLNGGLFPETHRPVLLQKLLLSPFGRLIAGLSSRRKLAANLRAIAGDHKPSEAELDAAWQLMSRDGGRGALPGLIRYIRERREHRARWVGALERCPVPLTVIDGLVDPISGAHMIARLRELKIPAHIVELPGVGHYPQIEAPAAVLAAVQQALATMPA